MIGALFRREFRSYFATPVAYVFIVIFLMLMGAFTGVSKQRSCRLGHSSTPLAFEISTPSLDKRSK